MFNLDLGLEKIFIARVCVMRGRLHSLKPSRLAASVFGEPNCVRGGRERGRRETEIEKN